MRWTRPCQRRGLLLSCCVPARGEDRSQRSWARSEKLLDLEDHACVISSFFHSLEMLDRAVMWLSACCMYGARGGGEHYVLGLLSGVLARGCRWGAVIVGIVW